MMWKITVTMVGGESRDIEVSPSATVLNLKQLIQQKMGVQVKNQKLVFVNGHGRTDLSDNTKPLSYYGMSSGSQVNLLVIPTPAPTPTPVVESFEVFLRNDKGQTTTYNVRPTDTVGDFKKRVQSEERVPVDQMNLVYEGRTMSENHLTLKDYGVRPHGTIYLTLRLQGG